MPLIRIYKKWGHSAMSSFKVFKNITKYAYMLSLQVVGASCIQNGGQ